MTRSGTSWLSDVQFAEWLYCSKRNRCQIPSQEKQNLRAFLPLAESFLFSLAFEPVVQVKQVGVDDTWSHALDMSILCPKLWYKCWTKTPFPLSISPQTPDYIFSEKKTGWKYNVFL